MAKVITGLEETYGAGATAVPYRARYVGRCWACGQATRPGDDVVAVLTTADRLLFHEDHV